MKHYIFRFAVLMLAFAMITLAACSGHPTEEITEVPGVHENDRSSKMLSSGSYNELLRLMNSSSDSRRERTYADGKVMTNESAEDSSQAAAGGADTNFSGTNIQTTGVDEADIIKTDGSFLYVMANNRINIIDISLPENMRVVSSVKYQENFETAEGMTGEYPIEFYLDDDRNIMTVITNSYKYSYLMERQMSIEDSANAEESEIAPDIRINPITNERDSTEVYIYDISNPEQPVLERKFAQEGVYISSRRVGANIYLVSQENNYHIYGALESEETNPDNLLPRTSQDGSESKYELVEANKISVIPNGDYQIQTVITAINTADLTAEYESIAVIGSSGSIYSSENNLYIAAQRNVYPEQTEPEIPAKADDTVNSDEPVDLPFMYWQPLETFTDIYRFALSEGSISFSGYGTVPGWMLNQFSMDEYDGYLRIAVTEGDMWADDENMSENNLYVLNDDLQITGSVKGLARGESIKSVRFMGSRAWIVTFRTTDPLFGIDLSSPSSPVVKGELKIPGYSAYLHPISENEMLGFGYDVEVDGDNAFEKGLKISLFDIADMSNPKEKAVLSLGGSGSWSELIYQHKSLMADPENNIYAFPAMLADYGHNSGKSGLYFQGLIMISTGDDKISVKGGITQINGLGDWTGASAVASEAEYRGYGNSAISRGIRIGESVFTLSQQSVQSNRLSDLTIIAKVELPGAQSNSEYSTHSLPEKDLG